VTFLAVDEAIAQALQLADSARGNR